MYGRSWVTWITATLVLLISIVSFGDLSGLAQTFGFIPAEYERMFGLTLISTFFLHGGIFHLLSNLYFLVIYSRNGPGWLILVAPVASPGISPCFQPFRLFFG